MRLSNLVLALVFVLGMTTMAVASEIKIEGSTTVYPIMQCAIEAYMKQNPDVNISLSGGGSSLGIKGIIDNTLDIGMASRKMKDKEQKAAAAKGVTPKEFVVAYDAVVPIVSPSNKLDNLSIEQLQGIYTGNTTNWKDVGGASEDVVVISRDSSSGTYETWQHFVVGKKNKVTPRALLQASSGAVKEAVAKNPKAISYEGIGYVVGANSIKGLKVNGIEATEKNVKDGTYPIARTLQIYTNGEPKGDVKKFIDWLMSEGQECVTKTGFFSVN